MAESETVGFGPEEKSVSRKHITITVSAVKPGGSSSVHTRSEVRIQDESAKFGTEIDGERVVSGSSTLLKNDEHSFRLGKTAHPAVLSVSFGSKETKAGKDPLSLLQNRLEHTDIKLLGPYVIGQTTHVVQAKRNTAKGLQALINGKHIVTETFIDALVYATAPTDFDHDESLTPLEEDFPNSWPDPMKHVPPKGKEPNERPFETFAPNPDRANVFEGYTFVLCEKAQFESLQGPITNGGGKALHYGLTPGTTTTDELVGYVKNVAGEKGLGELEDGSEGKGVVVVKFRGAKDDFEWAAELVRTASLALDLRFIEQNEFMDAILMNDASVLRRPLETTQAADERNKSNGVAARNGTTRTTTTMHRPQPEPEAPQPPEQPRQRGLVKSRFKGFSDSDDDDIGPSMSSIPQESSHMQTQTPNPISQPPNSLKRPAPTAEDDNEEFHEQLFPAATAIKRRRLEENEAARLRGESPPTTKSLNDSAKTEATKTQKPPPPELDIKKSLRERREAADRAAARDQETLNNEDLSPTEIEAMRNLAVIEEFDIVPHNHHTTPNPNNNGNGTSNARWNPLWNGRQNFKKFRRQGDSAAQNARRGTGGVIVPLEEVKKKTMGLGEDYWLEKTSSNGAKGKRKRGRETQSLSQGGGGVIRGDEDSLMDTVTETPRNEGVKKRAPRVQHVPRELKMEDPDEGESAEEMVDVEAPRVTRGGATSSSAAGTGTTSQQRNPPSQRKTAQKPTQKPTAAKAKTAAAAKKPALGGLAGDEESDSEDELKFRFGKRRRVG
ncbi:MAG: hypothetical protein Q9168_005136 [Polycauliona sp. 1 TL-2023]